MQPIGTPTGQRVADRISSSVPVAEKLVDGSNITSVLGNHAPPVSGGPAIARFCGNTTPIFVVRDRAVKHVQEFRAL